MKENPSIMQTMIDMWSQWQKKPNESITSKRNLTKIIGVVGAMYAYKKLTPETKNDKPIAALLGIAALSGLIVPSKHELDSRNKLFYHNLTKRLISESREDQNAILNWLGTFTKEKQLFISEFFIDENIDDVVKFFKNQENRERTTELIENSNQFFEDKSLESVFKFKFNPITTPKPKNLMTINNGACLIGRGFSEIVFGKSMKCVVSTPYFEMKTKSGTIKIPTNKIIRIIIEPKMFGEYKASIDTLDKSSYKGTLITRRIEVIFDDGTTSENGIKLEQLSKIEGKEIIEN